MNKSFKKYKQIRWTSCGFRKHPKHCNYATFLYAQPEQYIYDVLGKVKGRLFIKNKGKFHSLDELKLLILWGKIK
mgnify:CR=1 FL=1